MKLKRNLYNDFIYIWLSTTLWQQSGNTDGTYVFQLQHDLSVNVNFRSIILVSRLSVSKIQAGSISSSTLHLGFHIANNVWRKKREFPEVLLYRVHQKNHKKVGWKIDFKKKPAWLWVISNVPESFSHVFRYWTSELSAHVRRQATSFTEIVFLFWMKFTIFELLKRYSWHVALYSKLNTIWRFEAFSVTILKQRYELQVN